MNDQFLLWKHDMAAGFAQHGFSISADQLPDAHELEAGFVDFWNWWRGLDERTAAVLDQCDIAIGVHMAGIGAQFPALASLLGQDLGVGTREKVHRLHEALNSVRRDAAVGEEMSAADGLVGAGPSGDESIPAGDLDL